MTTQPEPVVYQHPHAHWTRTTVEDGNGNRVVVTVDNAAQPWLITLATRAAKAEAMRRITEEAK